MACGVLPTGHHVVVITKYKSHELKALLCAAQQNHDVPFGIGRKFGTWVIQNANFGFVQWKLEA